MNRVRSALWLSAEALGETDEFARVWLHLHDGQVRVFRLQASCLGRDDVLAPLVAASLADARGLLLEVNDPAFGWAIAVYAAPVVPLLRAGRWSERGDRLCPSDPPNLVHAADMRCGHHDRIGRAVRRRGHHHDSTHARNLGGQDVHQHRRGIGGAAAGDIDPGRIDRVPARAKPCTRRIAIVTVLGLSLIHI